GAGWFTILWRVILPNLRVAILSGAFLTLAIVVGEFTVATFLARHMFATYLQLISGNRAYEPAAVALFSFLITWAALGIIALIGRGRQDKIELTGAH
ncbi:MAG TPA: ABC transporter permease subunit, partial [Candidatus Limnocylindrales bacterium]